MIQLRSQDRRGFENFESWESTLPISDSWRLKLKDRSDFRRRERFCSFCSFIQVSFCDNRLVASIWCLISVWLIYQSFFAFYGAVSMQRILTPVSPTTLAINRTHRRALLPLYPPGNPPIVDRSVLHKLQQLEDTYDSERAAQTSSQIECSSCWPPLITSIPEPPVPSVFGLPMASHLGVIAHDTHFCGYNPCQLIIPTWIAEQESDAKLHFIQIAELALKLNRTLVLPNVGRSRLGTCMRHHFSSYYDVRALLEGSERSGLRAVTLSAFSQWVSGRPQSPTAQIVVLNSKAPQTSNSKSTNLEVRGARVEINTHSDTLESKHKHCLKSRAPRLLFGSFSPVSISPINGDQISENKESDLPFAEAILETLISPEVSGNFLRSEEDANEQSLFWDFFDYEDKRDVGDPPATPDVLALEWSLQYPIYSSAGTDLTYSPRLATLANKISAEIQPFLTIYWHMEQSPAQNMATCAVALVETLRRILTDTRTDVHSVWFAGPISQSIGIFYDEEDSADMPTPNTSSGSSKDMRFDHREALIILQRAFSREGELASFHLVDSRKHVAAMSKRALDMFGIKPELFEDSGVMGIIDKMMARKAAVFVTGNQVCARPSSFIEQIIDKRRSDEDNWNSLDPRHVQYVVNYFG